MKLLILALGACGASRTAAPPPPAELETAIDKAIESSHLLGLAVEIVQRGQVVLEKGYGFTSFDKKTPIAPDTIFAIGSLTKQFTAAAVLRLVDLGKLSVTDRIGKYMPVFDRDITIEQLLWQTAGLPEYAWGINVGKTPDELVKLIATKPADFAPGTKWKYSNSNYYVLGRLVELISRQSYADFLRLEVFARAGLVATSACGPETAQARPSLSTPGPLPAPGAAKATSADPWSEGAHHGSLDKGNDFDFRFYGGAGSICSTARDLLRWQDALFGGKVLSPSSLAIMTTNGHLADGSPIDYAAGVIADRVGSHRRIWHNGAVPNGYESELAWYPDDRLQIVLLTNTLSTPPAVTLGELESKLAHAVLHVEPPKAADKPLARGELEKLTGHFKLDPIVAAVTIDGDHLHVHIDGGVDDRLLAQGDGRFVLAGNHAVEYRFVDANTIVVSKDGQKLATLVRADPPQQ